MKQNNKISKFLWISFGTLMFIGLVFGINFYAKAHFGGHGFQWMDNDISQEDYMKFHEEKIAIMEKYGIESGEENDISKEDWLKMSEDMYDLMEKYDMNPGMMMRYGKKWHIMGGTMCPGMWGSELKVQEE